MGVIKGNNAQLDLNDPGVKVVRLSDQRTSTLIRSLCEECNRNIVSIYQYILYIMKQGKESKKRSREAKVHSHKPSPKRGRKDKGTGIGQRDQRARNDCRSRASHRSTEHTELARSMRS